MGRPGPPTVKRVLVATDRSETADRAVRWAADLAASREAELQVLQVIVPLANGESTPRDSEQAVREASAALAQFVAEVGGPRARPRVIVAADPTQAILDAIDQEGIDVVVVGNVGMSGRKRFLLANLPNRISHNARCTTVIVNTGSLDGRGGPTGQKNGARGDGTSPPTEGRLLRRAWRIGRVAARAGLKEFLTRRDADLARARAQRLREALEELGPTFAKLGQIMSTRPDLLPPTVIDELAKLQEHVPPLTEAEVVAVMEQELGVPWEDVFASIDPIPLAAGTIAQVHRATLETGEHVVVKVQRPTAEEDILQDLGLLERFAEKAAERPAFREVFDIPAMVEHLSTSLRRELNFQVEASNLRRMRDVLAPFSRVGVPRVYDEYSTARLLVMEEIQGGPVRDAPTGEARHEAARQLLESFYKQVIVDGFFHADPHPGNMKWWNDRVYFLDLGMVGELDERVREQILLLILAFSQRDSAFLAQVVLTLSGVEPASRSIDLDAFQMDLASLIEQYRNLSLQEMQLGPMLQKVSEISVRHHVRVPASLLLAGKAFAQMQLVASDLDPTLDPFAVAETFLLRSTLQQLSDRLSPRKLFYETQKTKIRLVRLLEAFEGMVGARPGGQLRVQFGGTGPLEAAIARGSLRLSLAFGLSSGLVMTVLAANSGRVPRWVPALTGGISSLLAAGLLRDGLLRRG